MDAEVVLLKGIELPSSDGMPALDELSKFPFPSTSVVQVISFAPLNDVQPNKFAMFCITTTFCSKIS